ncbi:hypothetical protein AYO21_10526 [Fonsecaea monophora]|uniref:Uncharacterized protein n=1 Tax=Fonsecaea monophora TaxID=254056 RepID=A0A177ETI4_9EURO|nr:hypothetical protein AYO21_10526 [Fonsecaea monophora]KAH0842398.1 hypothetical protein FOPE_07627 [Fonsecaea pedrosoi]OAG35324.1 hypothetical protein AYO21_10526 [Fonsecaea monophora]
MAIRVLSTVTLTLALAIQVTALPRRIFQLNRTDITHHMPVPRDTAARSSEEQWVCVNEDLELDPVECPPGTPGGIPKAVDLYRVRIGCNGLRCPHQWVFVDAGLPRFNHTCPRHAVAAAANWRNWCFLEPPFYMEAGAWCVTGSEPVDLTLDGPSIDRCCGEWVSVKDPFYRDYPTVQLPDLSIVQNKIVDGEEMRRVLKPNAWEFNIDNSYCRMWMSETEAQYQYFMQNLAAWDIDDADLLGHGGPRFNIKWDKDQAWGHLPP